ncbi:MAG: hypothetical protein LBF60_00250, partial [Treponema sp.]|nr:hypothetical protein [Treponema sp.]
MYIISMIAWDFFNNVIIGFPPVAFALLLAATLAAVALFIAGFAKHGVNFLKYGFKQMALDASLEKRFDDLDKKMTGWIDRIGGRMDELGERVDKLGERVDKLGVRLDRIEINHFGHLKKYLTVLNGILLDKNV